MASALDYFPIIKDAEFIYDGLGLDYGDADRYLEFTSINKQQFKILNPRTQSVSIYEYDSKGVKIVYWENEIYYRQNFLDTHSNIDNFYHIRNPIEIGTTWNKSNDSISTITNIDTQVGTPYQIFTSALEITTVGEDFRYIEYYEKNIGLVKSIYYSYFGYPVVSVLKEIKTNTPITESISFFYPHASDSNIWYVDKLLDFYTNDSVKKKFQFEFQNPPDYLAPCIGPKTYINYLYLDDSDNTAHIDFSSNFVSDLNSISGNESLSLLSITNTLGQYYMTEKVYITIEDNPYQSNSIQIQPGEPFQTDYDNILEWKNHP